MLRLAIVFAILALIAALFGFNVLASTFGDIAQIAFWIFLVIFVVSLLLGLATGRRVVD